MHVEPQGVADAVAGCIRIQVRELAAAMHGAMLKEEDLCPAAAAAVATTRDDHLIPHQEGLKGQGGTSGSPEGMTPQQHGGETAAPPDSKPSGPKPKRLAGLAAAVGGGEPSRLNGTPTAGDALPDASYDRVTSLREVRGASFSDKLPKQMPDDQGRVSGAACHLVFRTRGCCGTLAPKIVSVTAREHATVLDASCTQPVVLTCCQMLKVQ